MTEHQPLPPLSQSRQADMACSLLYVAKHVRGIRTESEAARRGSEIHKIIAQYMDVLGITKQQTDYAKMAELTSKASPEAREVLERFCESWFIDSEKIYDTEVYIAADDDFKIVAAQGKSQRKETPTPGAAHEGTLDLIVMESETEATIYDWKSYYQIVDADTFQSEFYPLLLMLLNPRLERVRFVLSFVRYGDAQREATWTREDLPKLKQNAERERARLSRLQEHAEFEGLKATPGRHCTWCPLLLTECPMKQLNPYANLEKEERVALALWMSAAKKENDAILKNWLIEDGPIVYLDANQTQYVAEFREQERRSYPLGAAFRKLMTWFESHPDDQGMVEKLTVSGLSSPLKAKKRAALAKDMEEVAVAKTITRLAVGRPGEEEVEA